MSDSSIQVVVEVEHNLAYAAKLYNVMKNLPRGSATPTLSLSYRYPSQVGVWRLYKRALGA